MAWLSGLLGLLINPCLSLSAVWLSGEVASGAWRWVVAAGLMMALRADDRRDGAGELHPGDQERERREDPHRPAHRGLGRADLQAEQRLQARRQDFEGHLANALDMADGEPEVIASSSVSFAQTLPSPSS